MWTSIGVRWTVMKNKPLRFREMGLFTRNQRLERSFNHLKDYYSSIDVVLAAKHRPLDVKDWVLSSSRPLSLENPFGGD